MKKLVGIFIVIVMIISLQGFNVFAENSSVIPTEIDYTVNGGTITGLKKEYLDTLTTEEKLSIYLILPDIIGGVSITALGNNAFDARNTTLTGVKLIGLDLSNMKHLKSIGQYAFYNQSKMQGTIVLPETVTTISNYAFGGCSLLSGSLLLPEDITTIADHAFDGCLSLSGNLVLPNSLISLGTYAFTGCKGMKGTLTLPNNLEVIPNYAFKDAGFTGELIIPSSVKTIKDSAFRQSNSYQGFSGKLIIPDNITMVEQVAFSYQTAITSVVFSKNMKEIPTSMFRSCTGLTGSLYIPQQIQSIGRNAFTETSLKTVYLPKMLDQNNTKFVEGYSFYSTNSLTALIAYKEDYDIIKPLLKEHAAVQNKLTYEKEIEFKSNSGVSLQQKIRKLYNRSYNYVKQQDDTWIVDNSYTLPEIMIDGKSYNTWAVEPNSRANIVASSIVGNETVLYPVNALSLPVVTFSDGIDKVYDGQVATVKVNAFHPDAVPIKQAKDGDVVFYYVWQWLSIGGNIEEQKGFDLDTCDIIEVRADYAISLRVTVTARYVENNIAKTFDTSVHDFSINLQRADSLVNPIYEKEVSLSNQLPSITLDTKDTQGTITWDQGQTLQQGTHTYNWTFSPKQNSVGFYNYKEVKGSAQIRAGMVDITINKTKYGEIITNPEKEVCVGSDLSIVAKPDFGYRLATLKVNGIDYTKDVQFNKLILKNVQDKLIISATFEKISVDNIGDLINNLPVINLNQPLQLEQVNSILEAKENIESLNTEQGEISRAIKDQMNELIASLPQVTIDPGIAIVNSNRLLDNMTVEDTKILLNDPNATFQIGCNVQNTVPSSTEISNLETKLPEAQFSKFFDIKIEKKIVTNDINNQTELSNLNCPIQLKFSIPTDLPQVQDGYTRQFYMARIHEEDGKQTVDILANESKTGADIVVSSDKFSLYAIAYVDKATTLNPNLNNPDVTNLEVEIPNSSYVKPNNANKGEVIDTGDLTTVSLWGILNIVSLTVMLVLCRRKKEE